MYILAILSCFFDAGSTVEILYDEARNFVGIIFQEGLLNPHLLLFQKFY